MHCTYMYMYTQNMNKEKKPYLFEDETDFSCWALLIGLYH